MEPGNPDSVEAMFDRVASNYDFLNDLFSIGLHRVWKREFISMLSPNPGEKWIDLCCGTGDITMLLSRYLEPNGQTIGLDYASKPLQIARRRAKNKSYNGIQWLKQDALRTGLRSGEFDGVLIAYGLRNLSDPKAGLREIKRLLKPSGKAGILDFQSFDSASISKSFQQLYLRNIVVPFSSIFGLDQEYSYLEKSLESFPSAKVQKEMALEVGFKKACFRTIAFGQMGILLLENN